MSLVYHSEKEGEETGRKEKKREGEKSVKYTLEAFYCEKLNAITSSFICKRTSAVYKSIGDIYINY